MAKAVQQSDKDTATPKTATINVPILGGPVTVRALAWEQAGVLADGQRDPLNKCLAVIVAGVVSPPLTIRGLRGIIALYGERPLLRVLNHIVFVSGFGDKVTAQARRMG